jgi:DNA adenine methylase
MTLLRRLGNKGDLSKIIIPYFPEHNIYIEPFFGAGGMFFNKPKAQYNILNDLDSDVSNLFLVLMNQEEGFKKLIQEMPCHSALLDHWKKNKETEPIQKAVRFLFLSNYTLYGVGNTLRMDPSQHYLKSIMKEICFTQKYLKNCTFTNWDFRKFITSISMSPREINESFIYADPPLCRSWRKLFKSFYRAR